MNAFLKIPEGAVNAWDGGSEKIVFYMSTDETGWSVNMTRTVQQLSHEIWDECFGTTRFRESLPSMDSARVCMNQDGVGLCGT